MTHHTTLPRLLGLLIAVMIAAAAILGLIILETARPTEPDRPRRTRPPVEQLQALTTGFRL